MSQLEPIPSQRSGITSAIFLLLTTLIGFYVVGPTLGVIFAMGFIDVPFGDLPAAIANPMANPWVKIPMYIIQGTSTFIGLIVGPSLYWYAYERESPFRFIRTSGTPPAAFLMIPFLVISFSIANSFFITWNSTVDFPEFMQGLERWARALEDQAALVTDFVTTFNSTGEFIMGLVVIALLPAVGEELVFRGMLQPKLQKATNNSHAAIWISAFLFSAMHMQFFGFVPRLFLGALFGYLYGWSGNLLIPILAHFVNNGFGVLMIYMRQLGKVKLDVQSTEPLPWAVIVSGTILTFGLLLYFRNIFTKKTSAS